MKTGIALLVLLLVSAEIGSAGNDVSGDQTAWGARAVLKGESTDLTTDQNPYDLFPRQIVDYVWEENAWQLSFRSTATRNGQGRVTQIDFEVYDEFARGWMPQSRAVLSYSSHSGPDVVQFDLYQEQVWEPYSRTICTYNGKEELVEEIIENIVATSGPAQSGHDWQPFSQSLFSYDGTSRLTEEVNSFWNTAGDVWVNSFRTTNTYTGNLLTSEVEDAWNGVSWFMTRRTLYTYTGTLETEALTQSYSQPNWFDLSRTTTTYNGNNAVEEVYQITHGGTSWLNVSRDLFSLYDAQGRPGELIDQSWIGSAWVNSTRALFEYDTPTSVDDDGLSVLPDGFAVRQNYPNPFNPTTTISLSVPIRSAVTVTIHDLLGRTVATLFNGALPAGDHQLLWDGTSSDGAAVASGVYFYRVQAPGGGLSRKMMLVK